MKILSTSKSTQAGFSLVELMVVISIVNFLAAMSFKLSDKFIIAASQAEAKMNIRAAGVLVATTLAENDSTAAPGTGSISTQTFSSDSSCNKSNVYGFKIHNCTKVRYHYHVVTSSSSTDRYFMVALNAQKGDGSPLISSRYDTKQDIWAFGANSGRLENPVTFFDTSGDPVHTMLDAEGIGGKYALDLGFGTPVALRKFSTFAGH